MEICSNAIKSLQVTVIRYIEECWLSFLKSLENTEEPVKNRWSFQAKTQTDIYISSEHQISKDTGRPLKLKILWLIVK